MEGQSRWLEIQMKMALNDLIDDIIDDIYKKQSKTLVEEIIDEAKVIPLYAGPNIKSKFNSLCCI